jgi:hypothetical protein
LDHRNTQLDFRIYSIHNFLHIHFALVDSCIVVTQDYQDFPSPYLITENVKQKEIKSSSEHGGNQKETNTLGKKYQVRQLLEPRWQKHVKINVREYRKGNQNRNRGTGNIGYTRRRKAKYNHCTICVKHHHVHTNTNKANKTCAHLQTNGKDEPNIVLMRKL